MNVKANCEKCGKEVILTSSYKGQPIICLECGDKVESKKSGGLDE